MNTKYNFIVLMQLNTSSNYESVINTINNFINNTSSGYKIIFSDDSQKNLGSDIQKIFPDIDVLHTRSDETGTCNQYISLSEAFNYAIQKFDFHLLYKMNAGTLITNNDSEKEVLSLLFKHPNLGIVIQKSEENIEAAEDNSINFITKRKWGFIRKPLSKYYFRKLYTKAISNGYKPGTDILAGNYFINSELLKRLGEDNSLPNHYFSGFDVDESELFSLFAKAYGFMISNLSSRINVEEVRIINSDKQRNEAEKNELNFHLKNDHEIETAV